MASKAQLVDYIVENFEGPGHIPVSRSKIESFKKTDLEEFIKKKSSEDELEAWLTR